MFHEAEDLIFFESETKESCETLTFKHHIDIDELREDDDNTEVYFDKNMTRQDIKSLEDFFR